MFLKLEGFQYRIPIYIKMSYSFTLTYILDEYSKLCAIVLPWMKYEHLWTSDDNIRLSVHVARQNNKLLYGFEFACVNIDDLIFLPRGDWANHQKQTEII